MPRQRYIVKGKVQGVGYRYWTHHTATMLTLNGWVRNLNDGSVELVADGDSATLDELEQNLWQGPDLCEVDLVEKHDADMQETFTEFSMRY